MLDEEVESGTFVDDGNDTVLTLKCHEILWKTLEPFAFLVVVVVVVVDFISTRIEEYRLSANISEKKLQWTYMYILIKR